jgi:hypothetical protein
MKYRVGPKASFIDNGRVYVEGDEIDGGIFKGQNTVKELVASGKLVKTEQPVPQPGGKKGSGSKNTKDNPPPAGEGDPPAGQDDPPAGEGPEGGTNDGSGEPAEGLFPSGDGGGDK